MARSSLTVVLLAVFAGAAAGMAVQLFNEKAPSPAGDGPAVEGRSDARHSEVETLVHRDSDRIRDAEIEIERLNSEISSLRDQITKQAASLEAYAQSGRPDASEVTMMGPYGKPVKVQSGARMPGMRMGGGKGFELARLPEEEKWAKLREELSLDSYQESELKQIATDYRKAMSDMFKSDGSGSGSISFGKIDLAKIMKARTSADERVKNLLSAEQHEKFKKENYGAAVGVGGATTVSVSTTFDSSEGK